MSRMFGVLAFLLGGLPAHAALRNCAELALNPSDYKVVLDEFTFTSVAAQNDQALASIQGRLQFNLNGQLEALRISTARLNSSLQVPVRLITCTGRQPSLTGDEFSAALVDQLNDQRVLVETWGSLDLEKRHGVPPVPHALVGFVMPSVQKYATPFEMRWMEFISYPKKGNPQDVQLDNLPELPLFVLVSLATKAAQAGRYDLAVWAFSNAETSVADSKLSASSTDLESILRYVQRGACLTRNRALADTAYVGALKLLATANCPGP